MGITDSNSDLSPSLAEVTRGSPQLEDELLAERLESAGLAWSRQGHTPTLRELVACIPILRSRPISLDAAIDVALRGHLASGLTLEESAEQLRADAPELADAIEAHLALRSMFGSLPAPAPVATEDLPRPFGPALRDGKQRYQLEEALGSGTQGVVFRAMDRMLAADGRPLSVAVKLLHGWQADGEQEASREAARATRIRHPGIAALLNCGSAEGQPYLVYDFIDGAPLDRWRARQAEIGERQAAKIVLQLAHAVQVAHNAGVVHRDLKPTNILIDRGGAPHITDFGLAAAMHRGKGDEPVGSLGFAAPEQLRAEAGGEDASVDVYALGGVLFWLLTGQFPNGGSPAEVRERLGGGGSAEPPDPAARCPGLDRTLGAICARALAPLARDRYASAAVLAVDLERWLAREPVMPFDRSVVRRARLWIRRSPAAAVAALVGAALILGSLGLAWRADLARRAYAFEQQLEMLRVRQEEQERRIEDARGLIQSMMRTMEKVKADSADLTWLPLVSGFESIGGDHGVDVTGMEGQMDHARIAAVRNHLASAAGAGAGDSVEIAVWETMLAFLLLKSERAHEAVPVLEANIARVERLFPADDPWHRNVTALRDLAVFMNDPDPLIADEARSRLELVAGELPENIGRLVTDTLRRPAAQSRLDR